LVSVDPAAPVRFLHTAYDAADWVAVFLKTYRTCEVAQRVLPVSAAANPRFQAWLRHRNANGWNVYVSVNAVLPGRSRTRRSIAAVRHVFLEEDADGPGLLAALTTRPDLPPPSYVLHSSPGRLHVLWRTQDFSRGDVEELQKRLARELDTDAAATSCSQTTRLPGFVNHKYQRPWPVFVEYLRPSTVLERADFPLPGQSASMERRVGTHARGVMSAFSDRVARARRFLESVEPAISGQHGDLRTFRICCRLVRGLELSDAETVSVLEEWNARCEPPWSERELLEKVRNARRYGREPYGGLL
jgi:RepB DNA-primase from phage plasmid